MTPEIQRMGADARQKHTDEQREFVRTAWASGKSAGVIAVEFSKHFNVQVSRGVIIGIKTRMQLPDRQTRVCRSYHNQKYVNPPKAKPQPPRSDLQAPEPQGPIGDFPERGLCKWPVNQDGEPFQCCGQPQYSRSSLCEYHLAKSRPVKSLVQQAAGGRVRTPF